MRHLPTLAWCLAAACSNGSIQNYPADAERPSDAFAGDGHATDTEPILPVVTSKYRTGQPWLFQAVPAATSPTRLEGEEDYTWNRYGPTADYVDAWTGWPWDHAGGDYLDADGLRQGPTPWFVLDASAVSGSTAVHTYQVDVTQALQFVQSQNRWAAFLLKNDAAPRAIAGNHQTDYPPPIIDVVYQGDSTDALPAALVAMLSPGSSMPSSGSPKAVLPAVLEFPRPTQAVKQATLTLTVVEHWSGSPQNIVGFVVDPPISTAPVVTEGLAAAHGSLDEGLAADPQVIGVHRYLDGTTMADIAYLPENTLELNTGAERNFDPAIWGGTPNTSLYPHRGLGKWVGVGDNWSLVPSSYADEDFVPLAPGLGALRVQMAAMPGITDGTVVGYSGTVAANAFIYLPEPDFGLLKRIFVRYYLRLGTPYVTPFSKRYQVYQDASMSGATWTDMGGKTGICPDHTTSYGGVSGSSGGGYGWQMRLGWGDCDAGVGGPDENAISMSLHTYDFLNNNPIPFGATDTPRDFRFGQRGGIGSVFYPGNWYEVEMEVNLNSVSTTPPGYSEDGEVRVWVDGRLVFERTGMVMRSLPLQSYPYESTRLRPARELGHRSLWFNWFHGGKTQNSVDRTLFVTGLVWARDYIGPMVGVAE